MFPLASVSFKGRSNIRPAFFLLFIFFFWTGLPCWARGDKIIPQVVDGGDYRTKISIINLSDYETISKNKIQFFKSDGTPWVLRTNLGTNSEFPLANFPRQTILVQTAGATSPAESGYAVIKDEEAGVSLFNTDWEFSVNVFYEILSGGQVVDTVSVSLGQPTTSFAFPVETNSVQGLFSGLAVVNLADASNKVRLDLWAGATLEPVASSNFVLKPGEQRAEFFFQRLFPQQSNFRGVLYGRSEGPVAILGLLQTRTASGVQYAALAPVYRDALRRNSYIYLRELIGDNGLVSSLDIDSIRADYARFLSDDGMSWDLVYESEGGGERRLIAVNGTAMAFLGFKDDKAFDEISLMALRALRYQNDVALNLNDDSGNLKPGLTLAVKTGLGHYAKVRAAKIVGASVESGEMVHDLVLEVYVFK